jgi:hypothetical protein
MLSIPLEVGTILLSLEFNSKRTEEEKFKSLSKFMTKMETRATKKESILASQTTRKNLMPFRLKLHLTVQLPNNSATNPPKPLLML